MVRFYRFTNVTVVKQQLQPIQRNVTDDEQQATEKINKADTDLLTSDPSAESERTGTLQQRRSMVG